MLWSNRLNPENISFRISGSGALYDTHDNEVLPLCDGTIHTITLSGMPMWIKGNVSNFQFIETEVLINQDKLTVAAGDSFSVNIIDTACRDLTTVVNCQEYFQTDGLTINGGKGSMVFSSNAETPLRTYEL